MSGRVFQRSPAKITGIDKVEGMTKILKREELPNQLDLTDQLQQDLDVDIGPHMSGGKILSPETINASAEGRRIILEAREEARIIKLEALAVYQRIQDEIEKAKKHGYETGKEAALADFSELMVKAHHAKEQLFVHVEKDAIRLIYDIAEKVLGHEFNQREAAVVELIRQALQTSMGQKITILVNPRDLEKVRTHQGMLMQVLDSSRTLHIRGDEKVRPFGCIIETEVGTIDAQLETQLLAIRKALDIEMDQQENEPAQESE